MKTKIIQNVIRFGIPILTVILITKYWRSETPLKQEIETTQPVGTSTILTDYQTALEIIDKEYPESALRFRIIMDSLNTK